MSNTVYSLTELDAIITQAVEILRAAGIESDPAYGAVEQPIPDNVFSLVDLTNLKPDCTSTDILDLCRKAEKVGSKTVCVNSIHVPLARSLLPGLTPSVICVVGFPLGQGDLRILREEIKLAAEMGVSEIDMVMPASLIKDKHYAKALHYLQSARDSTGKPLKVILETSLHTKVDIAIISLLCKKVGMDFVKTSTGFGSAGASEFDVALMRRTVGPYMGVKASGGIRTLEQAHAMVKAGASRIGASGLSVPVASATEKNASAGEGPGQTPGTPGPTAY